MAQKAIFRLPAGTRWRYVEGYISVGSPPSCDLSSGVIGHGWLTDGVEVFDTTYGKRENGFRMPVEEHQKYCPAVIGEFTKVQIAEIVLRRDWNYNGSVCHLAEYTTRADAENYKHRRDHRPGYSRSHRWNADISAQAGLAIA